MELAYIGTKKRAISSLYNQNSNTHLIKLQRAIVVKVELNC